MTGRTWFVIGISVGSWGILAVAVVANRTANFLHRRKLRST